MDSEKSNESLVNTAFAMAGILGYFVVSIVLEVLAGTFGVVARLRSQEVVQHGLPVAFGIATFIVLFANKKIHTWADECVTEVRKVVWPTQKDTITMTIVVCAMVLFCALCLGVWDFLSSQAIKLFV
jgi:preprotein translocase SecE subunit